MSIPVIAPVLLNDVTLRDDGFEWAHIAATSSHDISLIRNDVLFVAYPLPGARGTMYVSAPHPSGLAWFMAHIPDNEHGYGGARFELNMFEGPPVTVKGPWSSRESVVNEITGRELVDLSINSGKCSMERAMLQPQLHEINLRWTLQTEGPVGEAAHTFVLPVSHAPARA